MIQPLGVVELIVVVAGVLVVISVAAVLDKVVCAAVRGIVKVAVPVTMGRSYITMYAGLTASFLYDTCSS